MLVVTFVYVVSGLKRFRQVTKLRCSHYKNKSRIFKVETQHYKMKEINCLKCCRYMNYEPPDKPLFSLSSLVL